MDRLLRGRVEREAELRLLDVSGTYSQDAGVAAELTRRSSIRVEAAQVPPEQGIVKRKGVCYVQAVHDTRFRSAATETPFAGVLLLCSGRGDYCDGDLR